MKTRNRILAFLGVSAFTIYVLACQPAFSPNGKELIFPAVDHKTEQTAVLSYSLKTRRLETVLRLGKQASGDGPPMMAMGWAPDGKSIVVVWTGSEARLNVIMLPRGEHQAARFFEVQFKKKDDVTGSLLYPPQIVGRHLFVSGDPAWRIDLVSGEMKPIEFALAGGKDSEKGTFLLGHGDRLYCLTGAEDSIEVGRLDPETLARTSLYTFKDDQGGFWALTRNGDRMAVARTEGSKPDVAIYRGGVWEATLRADLDGQITKLGNVAWSRDETALYVAGLRKPSGDSAPAALVVLELAANGDRLRDIPIAPFRGDDEDLLTAQVALSPDGRTLAISTAFCMDEKMGREDRALYLVDVRRSARKVQRVPLSWPF